MKCCSNFPYKIKLINVPSKFIMNLFSSFEASILFCSFPHCSVLFLFIYFCHFNAVVLGFLAFSGLDFCFCCFAC